MRLFGGGDDSPDARIAELGGEMNVDGLEGDDEWDEEKEAEYQMRKQKAYEVSITGGRSR